MSGPEMVLEREPARPGPVLLEVGNRRSRSERWAGGCLMNWVSYANGDVVITDTPACTHLVLARTVHAVNDRVCGHRDGERLCAHCSKRMFAYGPELVGTTSPSDPTLAKRLAVGMAVSTFPYASARFAPDEAAQGRSVYAAARGWMDGTVGPDAAVRAARALLQQGGPSDAAQAAVYLARAVAGDDTNPADSVSYASYCCYLIVAAWSPPDDPTVVLDTVLDAYRACLAGR